MEAPAAGGSIKSWKPPIPGIREVLHVRFANHAYPLHTHDTWTLFIVDEGAIRLDLDRHARGAEPPRVSILPRVRHRATRLRGWGRLDAARDRILAGQPLADLAADVGFYDQAHLTRRFKKFLGITPGRFAQR